MSETSIPINRWGKVTAAKGAKELGGYVKVQDDATNTGGYLVLWISKLDGSGEGYDDWVEDLPQAQGYFEERGLVVSWLDEAASAQADHDQDDWLRAHQLGPYLPK